MTLLTSSLSIAHLDSLVIIAGVCGAGRSSALRKMSDLNFYTIDNLPVPLLSDFIEFTKKAPKRFLSTSLIVDTDSEEKVSDFLNLKNSLEIGAAHFRIIFLDSDTDTILKRYSESRRPHPNFNPDLDKNLEDTIRRERDILFPLKQKANLMIDTTNMSVHELRKEIRLFTGDLILQNIDALRVNFISFGFKYGAPRDCDLIIDIRFLPNPYFVGHLREKDGLDDDVAQYVLHSNEAQVFLEKYTDLINFLLPKYANEGKSYINIGVGCTGGKHRSVAIIQELIKRINVEGFRISVRHRDKDKDKQQ
jgi:RNase adapter protein RapZ